MLDCGFVTLAELKARLGINPADASDDVMLQRIINDTAAMIESYAGRTLRREHARSEYFAGGSPVIRVDVAPIAKVHSVRESSTRNFTTAGQYEELVEGTHYVLEAGADGGGLLGESGVIRRLGRKWLGSEKSPGQVQVVYTGGFKQDEEGALENGTVIVDSAARITTRELWGELAADGTYSNSFFADFNIDEPASTEQMQSVTNPPGNQSVRAIVDFDVSKLILPIWQISPYTIWLNWGHWTESGLQVFDLVILPRGLLEATPNELMNSIEHATPFTRPTATVDPIISPMTTGDDVAAAAISQAVRGGHLSFAVLPVSPTDGYVLSSRRGHSDAARWPKLTWSHHPSFYDPFSVPGDLRGANALQAIHEYQTRRQPGMIQQAMRGIASASGATYLKTLADLLPEVKNVAKRYRRLL